MSFYKYAASVAVSSSSLLEVDLFLAPLLCKVLYSLSSEPILFAIFRDLSVTFLGKCYYLSFGISRHYTIISHAYSIVLNVFVFNNCIVCRLIDLLFHNFSNAFKFLGAFAVRTEITEMSFL